MNLSKTRNDTWGTRIPLLCATSVAAKLLLLHISLVNPERENPRQPHGAKVPPPKLVWWLKIKMKLRVNASTNYCKTFSINIFSTTTTTDISNIKTDSAVCHFPNSRLSYNSKKLL